jgi:hypothetical protein
MPNIIFNDAAVQTLRKGEIYAAILETLYDAGWENISTGGINNANKTQHDWDVLKSTGVTDDDELYIQLCPFIGAANNATYNCSNTIGNSSGRGDGSGFSFRLIKGYTPGATVPQDLYTNNGSVGTIKTGYAPWLSIPIVRPAGDAAGVQVAGNTDGFKLYKYADADRCLFVIRDNHALGSQPTVFGFGVPEVTYNAQRQGKRDLIIFANAIYNDAQLNSAAGVSVSPAAANSCVSVDNPLAIGDAPAVANLTMALQVNTPLRNPIFDGRVMRSPIQYGQAAYGNIGELWGVEALMSVAAGYLIDGSILTDGDRRYEVIYDANTTATNMPTKYLAIRTA